MHKKISSTTKILILFLALLFAALSAYGVVVYMIFTKIAHVAELERELSELKAKEDTFKTHQGISKRTKEDRESLRTYFLPESEIVSFIEAVEAAGEKTNVAVELESVGIQSDADGPALSLALVGEGSFSDIFYFLSLFERMPYAFSFDRVLLTEAKGGNGEGAWTIEMTARLLSFLKET